MATLIDSSLWIDFTRRKSPERLKRFVAPYLFDASAHLAEPVIFELLRDASEREAAELTQHFATFPCSARRKIYGNARQRWAASAARRDIPRVPWTC